MADKYAKGWVMERNGDMEYTDSFILGYDDEKMSEHEAFMTMAMRWRGGSWGAWDEDHGGFWSDCTLISPFCFQEEIFEHEIEVARKFTHVMWPEEGPDENDETYSTYFDSDGNYISEEVRDANTG